MPSNQLNELFHKLILAIPSEGYIYIYIYIYIHTYIYTHTAYVHKYTNKHVDRHLIVSNICGEDFLKIC